MLFLQDSLLQVITARGMHQTGIFQSSYGAQFRINVKKGEISSMADSWPHRDPTPHPRNLPVLFPRFAPSRQQPLCRIAIQGPGPEFKACRQLLQPRIRFRNVVDTGEEEIIGVSRDSTKKKAF